MGKRLTLLALLTVSVTATAAVSGFAPAANSRPNILFIAVDDLNDWIGVLGGHPQTRTPNFDRLARRGTLFTNAYCAAPACNPSRAALLTGAPPHRSGVYHNNQPWRPALRDAVTLPQYLMAHGYRTMGSGKIFHGSFPDPPSWDDYSPSKQRQTPGSPVAENAPLNGIANTAHFDWGPIDVSDAQMGDAKVADWVAGQLRQKQERPFFLACGFTRPHLPWYVPRKYFQPLSLDSIRLPEVKADDLDDIPPAGRRMARPDGDHRKVVEHNQWRQAVQGYLASIAFADAMLGRVLDALDAGPHAQNTIVVLWGDHGWHLGEKQHWRKFALWEEATRTPLIFVVPRGVAGLPDGARAGSRCARPVSLMDIYPTLVELCGLARRPEVEARSLAPLLKDPAAPWEWPVLTTHGRGNHAVRSEHWRYIRYSDGSEELYDHQSDPMEWRNLAGDPRHADVKKELARWLPKTDAPDAPAQRQGNGEGE
jgi:arylsulfatase A-like enzyme